MQRLAIAVLLFIFILPKPAAAFDFNSSYYAVYETPGSSGNTIIYIVPKNSILIIRIPINGLRHSWIFPRTRCRHPSSRISTAMA